MGGDTSRLGRIAAALVLLAAAAWLIAVPSAQARESLTLAGTYDFEGQFGAGGPGMMDVHDATDSLYVVDPANNRILKFDVSDPTEPQPENFSDLGSNELTEADGEPLALAEGSQVAIDNSGGPQDGTIYLATDTASESRAYAFAAGGEFLYIFAHNEAQEFSVTGTPQTGRGIAVSSDGPRAGEIVRFGDSQTNTSTYTPSGTPGGYPTVKVAQVPSQFPAGISGVGGVGFTNDGNRIQVATAGLFGGMTYSFYNANTLNTEGAYNFGTWGTPFDFAVAPDGTVLARKSGAEGDFGRFLQTGASAFFPVQKTGTELLERFGAGAQGSGTGMVESTAGYLYATDTENGQINILGPTTAPDAEMLETGFVNLTAAEMRAEVNALDLNVESCEFQWGTNTNYSNEAQPCDVTPSGSSPTVVSAEVPVTTGATYHSRIVVAADNGTATYSDDLEWQAPDLPEAETLPAGPQQRKGTAVLGGNVDANGTDTNVYIEYSTDPGLEGSKSFPAGQDASAGDGEGPVRVFQVVDGLDPATTYYFRLVAVTKAGADMGEIMSFTTFEEPSEPEPSGCDNARFRTGPSETLPECRAYEQISPPDKNGGQVAQNAIVSSPGGDRVIYSASSIFAGAKSLGVATEYMAQRGTDGWRNRGMAPAPADAVQTTAYGLNFQRTTPDLSFATGYGLNVDLPGAPGINTAIFLWDNQSGENIQAGLGQGQASGRSVGPPLGVAADGNTGFFGGSAVSVDSGPPAPANSSNSFWWTRSGQDTEVKLASILPGGEPAVGGGLPYAISSNGDRLIWVSSDNQERPDSEEVYVRTDNGKTIWVSEAEGVEQPAITVAKTKAWTPDLRYVYFTSVQKLTSDATAEGSRADLYRFDTEAEELVDLTTEDATGGDVKTVMNLTPDGSRGLFLASGKLDGATGTGVKLYAWDGENIRFITNYPASVFPGYGFIDGDYSAWEGRRKAFISDDGRYFLFPFNGSTAGSRMDSVYETNGREVFYRYDWNSDRIDCVTCDPTGDESTSDSYLLMPGGFRPNKIAGVPIGGLERRFMTDDGKVLFNTVQGLVPRDVNGRVDTYLWDGDLKLVTDGTSDFHQWTEEASEGFEDIYVLSSKQLVPADIDGATDLYAASIGGGLASQQVRPRPAEPGCQGEACLGLTPDTPEPQHFDSGDSHAEPQPNQCARERAAFRRTARAVRTRIAAFRKARRSARVAMVRYKRGQSAATRRVMARDFRTLRRSRVLVKRVLPMHRRSKAALVRCVRGDS